MLAMNRLSLIACALCAGCGPADPAPGSSSTMGGGGATANAAGAAGASQAALGGAGGSVLATAGGGSGGSGAGAGGAGSAGTAGAAGSAGASGAAAGLGGAGGSEGLTPLPPCSQPSVSRLMVWETQVVGGTMLPASGSPLREFQGAHELYIEWTLDGGGSYGTANAPLNNQGEYTNGADPGQNGVDISSAPGVTLEYATTGNAYLQIRTASEPHGGDHFRADLPLTDGEIAVTTLNFADFRRPGGDMPPETAILQEVFSFTFVAGATTKLTLRQVLVPGFSPPCE
jgi:hypothetical protein